MLGQRVLEKSFSNSIFGDVYSTRQDVAYQKSYYFQESPMPYKSQGGSDLYLCKSGACYFTNGFFVFRPDGTYLEFRYRPDFSISDISLNTPLPPYPTYSYF